MQLSSSLWFLLILGALLALDLSAFATVKSSRWWFAAVFCSIVSTLAVIVPYGVELFGPQTVFAETGDRLFPKTLLLKDMAEPGPHRRMYPPIVQDHLAGSHMELLS